MFVPGESPVVWLAKTVHVAAHAVAINLVSRISLDMRSFAFVGLLLVGQNTETFRLSVSYREKDGSSS